MATKKKAATKSRSAVTGKFVSKQYAATHKHTTVTETVKKKK
jgi:hypothetical protein